MSTGKIVAAVVGVIVAIGVVTTVVGFGLGWFGKAASVVGPQNVSQQYNCVITEWESLQTAANNACSAQHSTAGNNSPVMVEDPAFAYAATFRKIVVAYNARQKDIFQAKLVGPAGYPSEVPKGLDKGPDTNWCDVAAALVKIGK